MTVKRQWAFRYVTRVPVPEKKKEPREEIKIILVLVGNHFK